MYHAAGQDGRGSASYIDATVLRQRNTSAAWPAALALGEGVADSDPSYDLGERVYYLQNWRADVVALVGGAGSTLGGVDASHGMVLERITYSPYGVPSVISGLDYNLDGSVKGDDSGDCLTDYFIYATATDTPPTGGLSAATRMMLDFDGTGSIDPDTLGDYITAFYGFDASPSGRGVLSSTSIANRKGYAGYEFDPELSDDQVSLWHVRHRVYDAAGGRWTRRDPLRNWDGGNLALYVRNTPILSTDPTGLACSSCSATSGGREAACGFAPPATICLSEITKALSDARVVAALSAVAFSCGGTYLTPAILMKNCDAGGEEGGFLCTPFTPRDTIEVCTVPGPNGVFECPGVEQMISVLLHEIEHAAQSCQQARNLGQRCQEWNNKGVNATDCLQRLKNEFFAYCAEPGNKKDCAAAQWFIPNCSSVATICERACNSSKSAGCYTGWVSADCMTTCMSMMGCNGVPSGWKPGSTPRPPPASPPPPQK